MEMWELVARKRAARRRWEYRLGEGYACLPAAYRRLCVNRFHIMWCYGRLGRNPVDIDGEPLGAADYEVWNAAYQLNLLQAHQGDILDTVEEEE